MLIQAGLLCAMVPIWASDLPPCPAGDGKCMESCNVRRARGPSSALEAKLRTISAAGHHVDTTLGAAMVKRLERFDHMNVFGFREGSVDPALWTQRGKYVGPCTGLLGLFWSKLIDDANPKDAVEVHELQYKTEAEAKFVAVQLNSTWDWDKYPTIALAMGTSTIVLEGRHRATGGLKRVGRHFGWRPPRK